jgi:valyl-tRNA synthetase
MSKAKGNVIDPIDTIEGITLEDLHKSILNGNLDSSEVEKAILGQKKNFPNGIPECGTDALRFALCAYTAQGRDINLDIKRVEGYRFFCNKIWNAFKFTLMNLGPNFVPNPESATTGKESPLDLWLLSKVSSATAACSEGLTAYEFPTATTACYNLWLYELCDVYLECLKPVMQGEDEEAKESSRQTLYTVVDIGLRLLHPFMPFITEELYQRLPRRAGDTVPSICVASYPQVSQFNWTQNEQLEKDVDFMQTIIHNVRSLRSEYNLVKQKVQLYVKCDGEVTRKRLEPFLSQIQVLTNSSSIEGLDSGAEVPQGCAAVPVNDECEAYLLLRGVIDVKKEEERLEGKRGKIEGPLNKLRTAVEASDYEEKVPLEVREANAEKLKQLEGELKKLVDALEAISLIDG